jgi:hypothetical protein
VRCDWLDSFFSLFFSHHAGMLIVRSSCTVGPCRGTGSCPLCNTAISAFSGTRGKQRRCMHAREAAMLHACARGGSDADAPQ